MIAKLGPYELLETLFDWARATYDLQQERYHIVGSVSAFGDGEADLPIGYLVNVCAALAVDGPCGARGSPEEFTKARDLASDLVALTETQWSLPFEVVGLEHRTLPGLLRDLAFNDGVRVFPQLAPRRATQILVEMSERLPSDPATLALSDAVALVRGVSSATRDAHGPCFLDGDSICLHSGLSRAALERLVPRFSLVASQVNAGFLLPEDFHKVNLHSRPLLAVPDGFWIIDPTITAAAFLDAVLDWLKAELTDAEARVGLAMESFLRESARARGLHVQHGWYSVEGQDGECDCVIETEQTIYLIECKYRQFHEESRTRDNVLLQDLRKVVLEPLVQAGGHEVLLRTHRQLRLHSPEGEYLLEWRGRRIERIAVTLREFGSLQSREVVERILTLTKGACWNSTDPMIGASLPALRRLSKKLAQQHSSLVALGARRSEDRMADCNCWALSLFQILMIIEEVGPGSPFDDVMEKTRHVRSGTLDEYYERRRMRNPSRLLQQLVEFARPNRHGFIFQP